MPNADQVLQQYQSASSPDERALLARYMLRMALTDDAALSGLMYIVNDENNSQVRLEITRFLAARRPLKAISTLAKQMFDPDPRTRAQAALGLSGYADRWTLAPCIAQIIDALSDGSTRSYAAMAVRTVTGKAAEAITHSERERVRRGETADTVWPEHFGSGA